MANNETKIPGGQFLKSLGKLEAMAKASDGDLQKSQLFHTSSNSEPKTWPGGSQEKYGENWDDNIGKDGTDYHPARKAIAEKAMKGLPLAPEEMMILKGDIDNYISKGEGREVEGSNSLKAGAGEGQEVGKGMPNMAKGDDEDDKDMPGKEEKDKACKSLTNNEALNPGFDASEFLVEFAKAFDDRLNYMEKSLYGQVTNMLTSALEQVGQYVGDQFEAQKQFNQTQDEFNKSMADVLVGIGNGVAGSIDAQNVQMNMPAGPPKSQLSQHQMPQVINKSFGQGTADSPLTNMRPEQVSDVLFQMVTERKIPDVAVSRYEMTKSLTPDVEQKVVQYLQEKRN